MSSDIDFSQFQRKPATQEVPLENEFAQFKRVEQQPISDEERVAGHMRRKVGGPAFEFITHAATAIPNLIDNIGRLSTSGLNALAKKFGYGLNDEQLKQAQDFAKQIGPTGNIPEASKISDLFHKATEGRFAPQTQGERLLNRGAGILGGITGFGPQAALGSPLAAAGSIAGAGTAAALEESGTNPLAAGLGGAIIDILTRSGGNLVKKLLNTASGGAAKTLGETVATVKNVKPEQIRQDVIDAAKRIGVEELPASVRVDNPFIQGVETKLRQSSLSGQHLENQLKRVETGVKDAYENITNQISKRENLLPSVVGEEASTALKRTAEQGEDIYRNMYRRALNPQVLPENAVVQESIGKAIQRSLNKTLETLRSDLGTPAKDALYKRLDRLKANWSATPELEAGNIPIRRLVEAKQDLNQIIKYEAVGGADKLLEPLASIMRNGIKRYGESNQSFGNLFGGAESEFARNARMFRKDPVLRSLVTTQNPESILGKMDRVRDVRAIEKALSQSAEGTEVFNMLKRYKIEQLVGSALVDKSGNISWGKASSILRSPKNRDLLQELLGKDNYNRLKDIVKVSGAIEQGIGKFANTSKTAAVGLDTYITLSTVANAFGALLTGNVTKAAKAVAGVYSPKVLAKLMASPEFSEAMEAVARAGKGSSREVFMKEVRRATSMIAAALAEDTQDEQAAP